MQALNVEEGTPSKAEDNAMIEIEEVRPLVGQIEEDVKAANNQLTTWQKDLERLQNYIKELEPISDVDLDVSVLRNPRYIHSTLGSMPAANLDRLETSFSRIPYVLLILRKEQENAIVWLTGAQFNADILERAARSAYLNPLVLAEKFEGAPSDIIKSLNGEIEKTQKEIEKQKGKINQLRRSP